MGQRHPVCLGRTIQRTEERQPSQTVKTLGRTSALSGLRGHAVLVVILFHAFQWHSLGASKTLLGGAFGVDLFFVLSGFLITHLLLVEIATTGSVDFRRFFQRRAVRLLPALGAFLIVYTAVFVAFHSFQFVGMQPMSLLPQTLLSIVAYVANWVPALGRERAHGTGHLWSLAVEEQFYMVWPVVLAAVGRLSRSNRVFWVLIGSLFVASATLPVWIGDSDRLYFGTDFRLQELLVGCGLAQLYTSGRLDLSRPWSAVLRWSFAASSLAMVALVVAFEDRSSFMAQGGYTAVALLCGVVVVGAVFDESRLGLPVRG